MCIYSNTRMQVLPGMAFAEMETGGWVIDESGQFADIDDLRHDPLRSFVDIVDVPEGEPEESVVERSERIFGDDATDPPGKFAESYDCQVELDRLIAEQNADDTDTSVACSAKKGPLLSDVKQKDYHRVARRNRGRKLPGHNIDHTTVREMCPA